MNITDSIVLLSMKVWWGKLYFLWLFSQCVILPPHMNGRSVILTCFILLNFVFFNHLCYVFTVSFFQIMYSLSLYNCNNVEFEAVSFSISNFCSFGIMLIMQTLEFIYSIASPGTILLCNHSVVLNLNQKVPPKKKKNLNQYCFQHT